MDDREEGEVAFNYGGTREKGQSSLLFLLSLAGRGGGGGQMRLLSLSLSLSLTSPCIRARA